MNTGITPESTGGGMKRIPSMLFDMELEESFADVGECDLCTETSEETYQLGYYTKLRSPLQQRVFGIVKYASQAYKLNSSGVAKKLDLLKFVACYLTLNGLTTTIRTSIGGGTGGECLQNLRHSYLMCTEATVGGSNGSQNHASQHNQKEQVNIELSFREHFAVARPSKKYQKFYDSIPEVVVGSMQNLREAVELICEEMRQSFAESKLPVPAWRKRKGIISKWLPKKWDDCAVTLDLLREWGALDDGSSMHTAAEVTAGSGKDQSVYSPTVRIGSF